MAIPIVITEGTTRAPSRPADACSTGDIHERTGAAVPPQRVRAEGGDVDVLEPIVVVVAGAHAGAPATAVEPGLGGDVGEASGTVVPVEQDHVAAAAGELRAGRTADEQDVEVAVVVVVDEGPSVAIGVDDVIHRRTTGEVRAVEAG